MPKESMHYTCIACLEECKHRMNKRKMTKFIEAELEPESESEIESELKSDNESLQFCFKPLTLNE